MTSSEKFFPRTRRAADRAFARWGRLVAAHPWPVIAVCVALLAVVGPYARFVEVSTNPEEFLIAEHPTRIAYTEFKDQFGSDNYVLITLLHDEIFSDDFLGWLSDVHDALENRVPYVVELTSLVNVRSTRGEGDELIVDDLLEQWPEDAAAFAALEARVASTPFHRRLVLSDDGRATSIQIELEAYGSSKEAADELGGFEDDLAGSSREDEDGSGSSGSSDRPTFGGAQEAEVLREVHAVLAEFARPDVEVRVAGTPQTDVRLFEDMGRNLMVFVVVSTLAVALVLGFVFRRWSGVLLPIIVFMGSLTVLLGFIGWRGVAVNMTIQILPSFLLAVGASAAIHLLVIFFQHFDRGESAEEALVEALGHAAMPITLACLTTAVGLGSFLVAKIGAVQSLGYMAPIGIGAALLLCLLLVPALLIVLPIRRKREVEDHGPGSITRFIVSVGDLGYRRPGAVLFATAVVVSVSLLGASQVRFDHDMLNWFPSDDPIHENTHITDVRMGGAASTELVIDTGRENGLHEPDFQAKLDRFEEAIQNHPSSEGRIRKTVSVNGVLKEIHQALHANDPAYYVTPDDRALIAQELLLFENSGSDDLEKVVDSRFQKARLSVRSTWGSGYEYAPYLEWLAADARETFPDARVSLTGIVPILMTSMLEMESGMKRSYALALVAITPLMMLLIGSLRGGLSSMVPNLSPIVVVVGLMGWLDVPFDVFTILSGSVAIGLAVDDTIHFLHGFYREFERTGDTRASIARTLETTGEALLTTTVVLSIGFSVFVFATMPTLQTFGIITTLAIALAFVADVLVAPALVTVATRHRQRGLME
jgi:predicted RND superfamily exporter protein